MLGRKEFLLLQDLEEIEQALGRLMGLVEESQTRLIG